MELDDFEQIARALFPFVDRFQLTVSGEPLMSKGLGPHARARGGVRCPHRVLHERDAPERSDDLADPADASGEICISFDGATKETFEYLREGATFEQRASATSSASRAATRARSCPPIAADDRASPSP